MVTNEHVNAAHETINAADEDRRQAVRDAAAVWQRHLVDLGGRNSLLWQRTDDSVELDLTTAHPAGVAKLLSGRSVLLSQIVRSEHAYAEAYEKALAIRDLSRELLEERGILSCFLALGRATWQMSGDAVPAAPILLRQCDIHFGGRGGDDLVLEVSRTVQLNSALSTYFASRGINIDHEYVTASSAGPHGFDPAPTYAMMRRAGASIPGFRIDERLVVSTFSYAKLSMVRDVAEQAPRLHTHPVVAAMAGDEASIFDVGAEAPAAGLDADPREEFLVLDADSAQQAAIDAVMGGQHLVLMGPPGTGKSQTIANLVATLTAHGKSALFVAEKRAAIDAVIGRLSALGLGDLMLDAHAGSGTPADLVDTLARRLVTAPAAGAPHVGDALRSPHGDGPSADGPDPRVIDELESERVTLIEHVRALHRVRDPFGVSAHDAQSRIAELNALPHPPRSRVRLEGEPLNRLDTEARDETGRTLLGLAQDRAWKGEGEPDAWFGARVRGSEHSERARDLVLRLAGDDGSVGDGSVGGRSGDDGSADEAGGELARHRASLAALAEAAGLPVPTTMTQASDVLDLMSHVTKTLDVFTSDVFALDLDAGVVASAPRTERKGAEHQVGAMERRRLLKEARATLRPGRPPEDLHAMLQRAADEQARWREFGGQGRPCVPPMTEQVRAAHTRLTDELDWLGQRLEGTRGATNLVTLDLDELAARLQTLAADADRIEVAARSGSQIDRLRALGLGPVVDDFAARGVNEDAVPAEWEFIWWTSVLERVRRQDPAYEEHRGNDLRAAAQRYAAADRRHLDETPHRVRQRAYRRIDAVAQHLPEQVEAMEAALVFGHHAGSADALRQAFAGAPDLMTALAPCWAMSPLVVAQTLPPGRWFDVVIFDEASQIPPAEAISAISRGVQVVVAGDTQQLAPTSFFQRTSAGEDTAHTGESVLDVLAGLLPVRHLRWHYRSLDERLIAFSNEAVYEGELITFPRADVENVLRLHRVEVREPYPDEAAPDQGKAEVEAVLDLVRQHAAQRPHESLGVITLGLTHARRLERAVTAQARVDSELAAFLAAHPEAPFFVKNLERVQGDERDAVILSLGIAPYPTGALVRRFGALNHVGGERRLNVAISRARRRMDVVSAFTGDEVDPAALRSRGAVLLRDFLLYVAECDERLDTGAGEPELDGDELVTVVAGRRRRTSSSGSVALRRVGADAVIVPVPYVVEDLARRLRAEGLVVHTGYGHSRMRVDLAVEHPREPGRMLLAVESDGDAYAAMGSVRERDRLRPEALERLGWHHDRVWTVDLFRDPARDSSRIVALVGRLLAEENDERF